MAHHHYCLGASSQDEQLAAMIDVCEHASLIMAGLLTHDTEVPSKRIE